MTLLPEKAQEFFLIKSELCMLLKLPREARLEEENLPI